MTIPTIHILRVHKPLKSQYRKPQMRKMVYMQKNILSIAYMRIKHTVLRLTSIKGISITGRKKSVHQKWLSWYQQQNDREVKVKISNLSPAERQMFAEAKTKEVESWLSTETVSKVLRHQIPKESILRCRWILTWKEADETSAATKSSSMTPNRKAKARLVVLGFEDPMVDQIPRDSPTMSKLSRVLILQHAASLGVGYSQFRHQDCLPEGYRTAITIAGAWNHQRK